MKPDRHQRIGELYHEALKLAQDQRAAFLAEACAGDEDLRREVESLLALDSKAASFIESPALEVAAKTIAADQAPSLVEGKVALAAGTRVGPYEILALLGAGGMGEVYRARDIRLDRVVAIKVIRDRLASDPTLRQRFEREARAVSQLNHPHICVLHDIGAANGIDYIVMEYLEGETLAQRLEKGPLPIEQALRYAIEIADALARAHRQGIVHRDLKPGNIILTKGGAKLVDFGVAVLNRASGQGLEAGPSSAGTHTLPLTERGIVVGTVPYMAPEQLEGKKVDARADIFAFGAVLYEMITGRRAFEGESRAQVFAAILHAQPAPPSALCPSSSPDLDRLVGACLEKDPEERWSAAGDLVRELKWIAEPPSAGGTAVAGARRRREYLAWSLAVLLAAALAGLAINSWMSGDAAQRPQVRASIELPHGQELAVQGLSYPLALSPDGRRLVYTARSEGRIQLYVRELERFESRAIPGTENGRNPFFSPDGRSIGFFAGDMLLRVSLAGGRPVKICGLPSGLSAGGTWGVRNAVVFAAGNVLWRVSAEGGSPATLVSIKESGRRVWAPQFLLDGTHVLFLIQGDSIRPGVPRDGRVAGPWHHA